jgi:hypothetical protein
MLFKTIRHSRESGNPAASDSERMNREVFRFESLLTLCAPQTRRSWIPAFAGMTFLFMVMCASPAFAAPPSVDPALCQALVKHVPDADVAYQPGVDVHGKAVAPADLPGQPQMQLPDQIKIPLTLNLAKTLNLNTSAYPYNQLGAGTEAQLGTLTVEGDRVSFNGQPLSDVQQDRLAVLCLQPK